MSWWIAYRSMPPGTYVDPVEVGRFTIHGFDEALALLTAWNLFGPLPTTERMTVTPDYSHVCTWCAAPAEFHRLVQSFASTEPLIKQHEPLIEQHACEGHFLNTPPEKWAVTSAWNRNGGAASPVRIAPPLSAWERLKRGGALYEVDEPAPPLNIIETRAGAQDADEDEEDKTLRQLFAPVPEPNVGESETSETITPEEHTEISDIFQVPPLPEYSYPYPDAKIGIAFGLIAFATNLLPVGLLCRIVLLLAGSLLLFSAGSWHAMDRIFGRKAPPR